MYKVVNKLLFHGYNRIVTRSNLEIIASFSHLSMPLQETQNLISKPYSSSYSGDIPHQTNGSNMTFAYLNQRWAKLLKEELEKTYFSVLWNWVQKEYRSNPPVYPPFEEIFTAFKLTTPENVKVVILGQDPYHGPGQAHGLSFSVQNGVLMPPSLSNIFKECCDDVGISYPRHGNLTNWAQQGVLLLNSILTVKGGKPTSHTGKGWERFTNKVIELTSENCDFVVFVLWGNFAKEKKYLINRRHMVIENVHPSPLSARRGFFGSKPFSKINEALISRGKEPINWQL